jgi:flagellar basal-body rod modification protein FlgD
MSTPLSVTTPVSSDQISNTTAANNSLQNLTANNFVQFLVTELQNQDPLNPTSSDQMLSQLSEIGQLQSSTNLTTSLQGMVQQNQIAAASGMIGKLVTGTDQNSNPVQGNVTAVQVTSTGVNLSLDSGATLPLANVTAISNPVGSATTSTASTTGTTGATAS